MRIIRNLREVEATHRSVSVAIGNFDGVHLAHQRLLQNVVQAARTLGSVAAALTFEPHPAVVLAPERAPRLLTPLEVKARLIEQQGIELLVVLPFTAALSQVGPREFVRQVLREALHAASVHVGPNFRFGHRQAGDVTLLRELAPELGFRLELLSEVEVRGERVSSSRVRELLSGGRVGLAGRLLGRPYSIRGAIVHGSGVGKKFTVPTLNLAPVDVQHPQDGVYVTCTRLGEVSYQSATNVGHKPTFGEHRLTIESYLLDFHGEVDAAEMEVEFLYRLRDEMKFPDPAALKAQIQTDARRSLKFFRLHSLLQRKRVSRVTLQAER